MTTEPTLADDEARLADIARHLEQALVHVIPEWLRSAAAAICSTVDPAALDAAITQVMSNLEPELARVLHADVDAGVGSPLAAVRAATAPITAVLIGAGATPPARDEFDVRAFPNDLFALGPAAFADVHVSLHEPGLVWGAARAHIHLRRRRETAS